MEWTTAETVPLTFNFLGTKVGRACIGQQTSLVGSALVLSPPSDPQELSHTQMEAENINEIHPRLPKREVAVPELKPIHFGS